MSNSEVVTLYVNGVKHVYSVGPNEGQIPCDETLLYTLRNRLHLTSVKRSCEEGACGCCTVLIDGEAQTSCMRLTVDCDGSRITTLEGLADPETGKLSPIQQAFLDYEAFQCGFCTPGIVMAAYGLFLINPHPTHEEIEEALSGNYCRCISHYHVFEALDSLAGRTVDLDEKWRDRR